MHRLNRAESPRLLAFIESLQQRGQLTFTAADALSVLDVSYLAFNRAAERLMKRSRLIHPARGFYVIVSVEHQVAGSPPATSFIDALMRFHGQPYYVGVLSAASLHGAAHQAPQELQVVTSAPLKTIDVGRSRIRFLTKQHLERTPVQLVRVPTGDIPISTPEATAFDLFRYPKASGYLSNISTLLIELAEKINSERLVQVAEIFSETPIAQRLGYLLDTYANSDRTKELHAWLKKQRPRWTLLRPGWKSNDQGRNEKWHVIVNEQVEPDI